MDHRSSVGPADRFDTIAALQFNLLTMHGGLRGTHKLLDIGCGCLRAGRLFIPYLDKGNYFGIEPNRELVGAGLEYELGFDTYYLKKPHLYFSDQFDFNHFGVVFDYLIAQSIFSHATSEQVQLCLKNAAAVMDEHSHFYATYVPGTYINPATTWTYPDTVKYPMVCIDAWAYDVGLRTASVLGYEHPTQQWVMFYK